jgi:hypothetical protein
MDTTEVARRLNTTPRQLRAFLRSSYSTFVAVGSGARYDFTEDEIPTIEKRFTAWRADGRPRPEPKPQGSSRATVNKVKDQLHKDAQVWAEEPPVVLEDLRDPRVRAQVRANAEAAENRLAMLLLSKGLHVAQGWTPPTHRKAS